METESDLHHISGWINLLFKFADDTNLFVPQSTDFRAKAEINNTRSWAFETKMEKHCDKTKELVFRSSESPLTCLYYQIIYSISNAFLVLSSTENLTFCLMLITYSQFVRSATIC